MLRLVATDLDGTLMRADGSASVRTRRVLRQVTESGVILVLVSGRPPHTLRQFFTKKAGSKEWPTMTDFVEHVDYVAQLTGGTDHVGIGTDMSLGTYPDHPVDPWGTPNYPNPGGAYAEVVSGNVRSPMRALRDFNSYPQVLDFAGFLLKRGYADVDVHKILGENFLRVFTQVRT
jgi:microsomal dipeptidase-like Zn-dependent dipeptidase